MKPKRRVTLFFWERDKKICCTYGGKWVQVFTEPKKWESKQETELRKPTLGFRGADVIREFDSSIQVELYPFTKQAKDETELWQMIDEEVAQRAARREQERTERAAKEAELKASFTEFKVEFDPGCLDPWAALGLDEDSMMACQTRPRAEQILFGRKQTLRDLNTEE